MEQDFSYYGNNAMKLKTIVMNRSSRFRLNLQGYTMRQVLEAYAEHKRKMSPRYRNGNTVSAIQRLEWAIGQEIMPIDITDEFYVEAFNILSDGEIQLKPSTIRTYFTNIKSSLNWASKHGCEIDPTFNEYNIPNYERTKIALTPSQIAHIYYYDISIKQNRKSISKAIKEMKCYRFSYGTIERVRDMFVLNCNIGQRHSDIIRMDRSNFDDTGIIFRCTQQKTGGKAKVDLTKYAIDKNITFEILKKYGYKCPAPGIDVANTNNILKVLCRAIGGEFLREYKSENKIKGEIVEETRPMWKMITSHTARRTFITHHCNNENVSIVKLQKCSGHKDLRNLSKYCIDMD